MDIVFQFHYGTIKNPIPIYIQNIIASFQFLYGAIKRAGPSSGSVR